MVFRLPDLRWFDPYPFIIPAVQWRVLRILWDVAPSVMRDKDVLIDTGLQVESVHSICVSAISLSSSSFAFLTGAFLTERGEFGGHHSEFPTLRAVIEEAWRLVSFDTVRMHSMA